MGTNGVKLFPGKKNPTFCFFASAEGNQIFKKIASLKDTILRIRKDNCDSEVALKDTNVLIF